VNERDALNLDGRQSHHRQEFHHLRRDAARNPAGRYRLESIAPQGADFADQFLVGVLCHDPAAPRLGAYRGREGLSIPATPPHADPATSRCLHWAVRCARSTVTVPASRATMSSLLSVFGAFMLVAQPGGYGRNPRETGRSCCC
jgi:hypothetical protein